MCVILCLTFQAKNVHGNVTSVDIESHHARDGAQCIIIVGTVLIIKSMERTAQDVHKVLDIKTIFELNIFRKYSSFFNDYRLKIDHDVDPIVNDMFMLNGQENKFCFHNNNINQVMVKL